MYNLWKLYTLLELKKTAEDILQIAQMSSSPVRKTFNRLWDRDRSRGVSPDEVADRFEKVRTGNIDLTGVG